MSSRELHSQADVDSLYNNSITAPVILGVSRWTRSPMFGSAQAETLS